jgi:hypothetical protein
MPQRSAPPRSKYRNVKTTVAGLTFDSRKEAERWIVLLARQQAGEIRDLRRQVPYQLKCPTGDPLIALVVAEYLADFDYIECATNEHIVEDTKGYRTRLYVLKRKWLELQERIVIREL